MIYKTGHSADVLDIAERQEVMIQVVLHHSSTVGKALVDLAATTRDTRESCAPLLLIRRTESPELTSRVSRRS